MMVMSRHAQQRMQTRHISAADVETVVRYGRTFYSRDAIIKVIGRREAEHDRSLARLDGLHVILSHDNHVITTYRNRKFRERDFAKRR